MALIALLAINAAVIGGQTKDAEATVAGGRILALPGGAIQVLEEGPAAGRGRASGLPIVLVHCYACSLRWWDRLAPLLARRHRVVRLDLLGHGGSEKPASGYSIEEQAGLVAAALDRLDVQGAVVVGHSMGFAVSVALAERASQLVDRLVNVGEGAAEGDCSLPFVARLAYAPLIGEATWRLAPDSVVERGYEDAFAPGFDLAEGFADPDRVVDDYGAMTFTSFSDAHDAAGDFVAELALDQRIATTGVPLLSIFGAEDRICDPGSSQASYGSVPGARLETIAGAGHSPNVERPEETARLIEEFAAEAATTGAERNPRPRRGR